MCYYGDTIVLLGKGKALFMSLSSLIVSPVFLPHRFSLFISLSSTLLCPVQNSTSVFSSPAPITFHHINFLSLHVPCAAVSSLCLMFTHLTNVRPCCKLTSTKEKRVMGDLAPYSLPLD